MGDSKTVFLGLRQTVLMSMCFLRFTMHVHKLSFRFCLFCETFFKDICLGATNNFMLLYILRSRSLALNLPPCMKFFSKKL
jgi:hypothetical protein